MNSNQNSVRFAPDNDERNTVHIFAAHVEEGLWVSEEEHSESKAACRTAASKLRRGGADRLFECSFANPAADVQKSLNEFAKHTDGRGLERSTSQQHYKERLQQRALAIRAILLGQEQALIQGLKLQDVSEQLRELSIQYCCSAKIFARRLGKADAYAVHKQTKSSSSSKSSTAGSSKKTSSSKKKKKSKKIDQQQAKLTAAVAPKQSMGARQRMMLQHQEHSTKRVFALLA